MEEELVVMQNQQAVTTSLRVAEVFGKRHDHILRDIEKLLEFDSPKLGSRMFAKSTYLNKQNHKQKMYCMNRDGFTLLYEEHSIDGTKQKVHNNLKWTQKGRKFIYDLLQEEDIHPIILSIED